MSVKWRKFFTNKEGEVVLFQRPNVPIIVWFLSMVLATVSTNPVVRSRFGLLATIAIIIWALMEIIWGASYFRRLLGAVVLIVVIIGRVR